MNKKSSSLMEGDEANIEHRRKLTGVIARPFGALTLQIAPAREHPDSIALGIRNPLTCL